MVASERPALPAVVPISRMYEMEAQNQNQTQTHSQSRDYEFLQTELKRVLSTRGKWTAMPALLDELHRLREQVQPARLPAGALG